MYETKTIRSEIIDNLIDEIMHALFPYVFVEKHVMIPIALEVYKNILIKILYDLEQDQLESFYYPLNQYLQEIYTYGTDYFINVETARKIITIESYTIIEMENLKIDNDIIKDFKKKNKLDSYVFHQNSALPLGLFDNKTDDSRIAMYKNQWYSKAFNLPFIYNYSFKQKGDIPDVGSKKKYITACKKMLEIDLDKFTESDKILYFSQVNCALLTFDALNLLEYLNDVISNYSYKDNFKENIIPIFKVLCDLGLSLKPFIDLASSLDLVQMERLVDHLRKNIDISYKYINIVHRLFEYDDYDYMKSTILSELDNYQIYNNPKTTYDNIDKLQINNCNDKFLLKLVQHTSKLNNYFFRNPVTLLPPKIKNNNK